MERLRGSPSFKTTMTKVLATQEELQIQNDLLRVTEVGTFEVVSNSLKDHLEVTRSLFAIAHNTKGMFNHARWVLGDILAYSGNMHGDEFQQELDSFAELINWHPPDLATVIRASKVYWTADMRKYSYDPHTWNMVFKQPGGEHCPLDWGVFEAMSRNIGHLDQRALDLLSYILWCQGYSMNLAKRLIKVIAMEDEEYTDEIAKIARMEPTAMSQYIASLRDKHKDKELRGNYLCLDIQEGEEGHEIVTTRKAKVDGYDLSNHNMIIRKTTREFSLITEMVDGKPMGTIIPTDDGC